MEELSRKMEENSSMVAVLKEEVTDCKIKTVSWSSKLENLVGK